MGVSNHHVYLAGRFSTYRTVVNPRLVAWLYLDVSGRKLGSKVRISVL